MSLYCTSAFSSKVLNWRYLSALALIVLTSAMTAFITLLKPSVFAVSASWCIIQWYVITLSLLDTSAACFAIIVAAPSRLPVIAGALSVLIPASLSHGYWSFSMVLIVSLAMFFPVVFDFMEQSWISSSLTTKSSVTPLTNTNYCTVSDASVLSSRTIE